MLLAINKILSTDCFERGSQLISPVINFLVEVNRRNRRFIRWVWLVSIFPKYIDESHFFVGFLQISLTVSNRRRLWTFILCKIFHNKETISPLEFCTPAWYTLIKTKGNNTRQILTLLFYFFYKNNFYALPTVYSKDIVFNL